MGPSCRHEARGQTPRGAVPVELAVPPDLFVQELSKRGIEVKTASRLSERLDLGYTLT